MTMSTQHNFSVATRTRSRANGSGVPAFRRGSGTASTLLTILAIKIEDEFKKIEFPITGFTRHAAPAWSHGSHARVLAAMAPDALRKKPPPPSRRLSESPLRIRGVLGRARRRSRARRARGRKTPTMTPTRRTALARTNARLRMASGESINPNPNPNQPSDGAEW